jgi:elongator complex protein 4
MDNNLAFRLKRRRFVIETLHLDIDAGTEKKEVKPSEEEKPSAFKRKPAIAAAKNKLKAASDW